MHDQRVAGEALLDLVEHLEVEGLFALELEGTVRGADGAGEGIAAGELHELLGFGGLGEAGVAFVDLDVLFHAAEHAELGFDGDALGVGAIHDALRDGDVFVELVVGCVDHDRAEEAGVDAVVASLLVTVIEMHREDRLGENLTGRADDGFQHALVGVFPGALGNLDDEGGFGINRALEQAHGLFGVVDVVSADGVFAVGVFEELRSSDDHGSWAQLK